MSWRTGNAVAGHVILGFPAGLAIAALTGTVARFGVSALAATVPALGVIGPWVLWLRYTQQQHITRRAGLGWAACGVALAVVLLLSPLWFWTGPVLVLLMSESLRVVLRRRTSCLGSYPPATVGDMTL